MLNWHAWRSARRPARSHSQPARSCRPRSPTTRQLYERRGLRMTWTHGGRELAFSGQLPLEQGAAFEQAIRDVAKLQRAADKKHGTTLEWQQSAADALVTLARQAGDAGDGVRRSPTTLIVHLSDDAPPMLEGAGPISLETAERLTCDARRLTIKLQGRDLVHSRVGRCASYPQQRALYKRSDGHCQYPGCTATRELEAHHILAVEHGGATDVANMILLCSRHHKLLHDYAHPHPRHRRAAHLRRPGRPRDHHQPTPRATPLTGRPAVVSARSSGPSARARAGTSPSPPSPRSPDAGGIRARPPHAAVWRTRSGRRPRSRPG